MDFSLTDEEQAFQEAVRRFGDKVLRPNERRIDSEGRIPAEVLAEMARPCRRSTAEWGPRRS
jgi:alkylation response protein AidB-like acyl-CoA dehydrogenase